MKIDKTTYIERKERLIGMTVDITNLPEKVLFFAVPHFLYLILGLILIWYTAFCSPHHKSPKWIKIKKLNFLFPQKNYFDIYN